MKSIVVLISGKQGSGKTTLKDQLMKKLYEVPRLRAFSLTFAEPLYRIHDFVWGMLKDNSIEMPFKKDGNLLQKIGAWGRDLDSDLWIKLLKSLMSKFKLQFVGFYDYQVFIISDCRFKNEFNAFSDALTIRLECERDVRKARCEMWRENEHDISETDLDDQLHKFSMLFHTDQESSEKITNIVLKEILLRLGVKEVL